MRTKDATIRIVGVFDFVMGKPCVLGSHETVELIAGDKITVERDAPDPTRTSETGGVIG